ncbi:MAG: substrate-binding domain-containing protein, partial [Rhodobacterales bacterium]|nr:substrate-binding domain-containing protein [Rhodobacterales bacterium]
MLLAVFLANLWPGPAAQAKDSWFPVSVDVWHRTEGGTTNREAATYTPLDRANRPWRICASIPHLKEPYWSAVNYGLINEARRQGVGLRLFEAGGYGNLSTQRQQIRQCLASGADALIVSAISADGLNDLVDRYAAGGTVVVDLINGITAEGVTAHCAVDFRDSGLLTAQYIRKRETGARKPVKVAW